MESTQEYKQTPIIIKKLEYNLSYLFIGVTSPYPTVNIVVKEK